MNRNVSIDRASRGPFEPARGRFGWAGIVVGVVALFGVDLAASKMGARPGKSAVGIVHVVASADAAAMARSMVATCVLALAFLLWMGRRELFENPQPPHTDASDTHSADSCLIHIHRGRFARHYAAGGLYGP